MSSFHGLPSCSFFCSCASKVNITSSSTIPFAAINCFNAISLVEEDAMLCREVKGWKQIETNLKKSGKVIEYESP
jgi:hypothetical protein